MKKLLIAMAAALAISASAQQINTPPTIYESLQKLLSDPNGLLNAGEVNVSALFKWNTAAQASGGEAKLDWWISNQQGAYFTYEEYVGRDAYWGMGYQARTVFKTLEVSIGTGIQQKTDDPFGNVKMIVTPTLTWKLVDKPWGSLKLIGGCDVYYDGSKPNPFVGICFRAMR